MKTLIYTLIAIYLVLPREFIQAQIIDQIPFELASDNRVYLKCKVNNSDTLRFLFDTGATDMIMNPNSPRSTYSIQFDSQVTNNGATGTNLIQASSDNELQLGNMQIKGLRFLSIPYPPNFWDGVIGLSFISQYPLKLDYDTKTLYVYERSSFIPPKNTIALKIEYALGVPLVPIQVKVNNRIFNMKVEIDTGSDRVLDMNTPFVRQNDLLGTQSPFAISRITSSDSNAGELQNVFFDEVRLGNMNFYKIPGAFSTVTEGVQASQEMDGVLGNNFLQRFNITLDLQNGYIYLEPNNLIYKPFYHFLIE